MVVRMPQLIPSWREKAPGTKKKQERDDFDYGSGDDGNESDGDKTAPGNVHTNPFGAPVPVPDTFAAAGIDDDNADVDDTDSVFDAACTWTRVVIQDETIDLRDSSTNRNLSLFSGPKTGPKYITFNCMLYFFCWDKTLIWTKWLCVLMYTI